MLYRAVRPLLFRLPAETAHRFGKWGLQTLQAAAPVRPLVRRHYRVADDRLAVEALDTRFPNPVGVAAGFDKNAETKDALADLGFGFVEVGTVTPEAQDGNPRPRLFRLPEDRAMVNRLGFNGHGVEPVRRRLARSLPDVPVGVNVGKMNDSGPDRAVTDTRQVFRRLKSYGDYFVVNVSCPNTPDEFEESDPDHLRALLGAVTDENDEDRPLLVKIGPDQDRAAVESLVAVLDEFPVAGVVATNTSTARADLDSPHAAESGGLSGAPLEERATETLRTVAAVADDLTLVGVGGVDSAESAYRKIRAGASLVQVYTGFVYGGPATARRINRGLLELLERDGFDSVEDAVGVDVP